MTAMQNPGKLQVVGGRRRGRVQPGQTDPLLPINPEAECMVIGAVIDWQMGADDVVPLLEPSDFYKPAHQTIWEVIKYELHGKGRPVTQVGIDDALAARGQLSEVGGQNYIISLKERAQYGLPAREYARVVFARARDRAAVELSGDLAGLGYNSYNDMEAALVAHTSRVEEWLRRGELFASGGRGLAGVLASEVERRAIEWFWRGRLAYGKLSILDGDPGKGKGLLEVDLAARATTGRALPDEDPRTRHEPVNVILVTPEDDEADTIIPRLEAAGADLARVRIINKVETDAAREMGGERPITFPRDIPLVEEALEAEDAALLIIDPIMACLDADVKTQSDQEVRAALQPLKQLVARRHVACLLVRHMNKSGGDKALYRGGGSIAFTGLARVAMLLAEHPDDDTLVALAGVKTNVGKLPATLSFSIQAEHEDAAPHITWQREEVQYSADALLGAKRSDERRDYLAVFQQNAQNGIHEMTPHEVALALGVPQEQEGKVRKMLRKMVEAGELRNPRYGSYAL